MGWVRVAAFDLLTEDSRIRSQGNEASAERGSLSLLTSLLCASHTGDVIYLQT